MGRDIAVCRVRDKLTFVGEAVCFPPAATSAPYSASSTRSIETGPAGSIQH